MWLISWPKTACPTKTGGREGGTTTATAAAVAASWCINVSSSHCTSLTKLVRKLRKHRRRVSAAASRQRSLQCHYDPLSYSLNFDASGCGNLLDDQDYFKFCAFSSRFVANPSGNSASTPRLITTTPH
ncbi:hypothetical protein ACFX14_036043 [Malus domestica]